MNLEPTLKNIIYRSLAKLIRPIFSHLSRLGSTISQGRLIFKVDYFLKIVTGLNIDFDKNSWFLTIVMKLIQNPMGIIWCQSLLTWTVST